MKKPADHYLLLDAYLDGELSAEERLRVEELLQSDLASSQYVAEMQSLRSSLAALPKRRLSQDFTSQVLQKIQHSATSVGPAVEAAAVTADSPSTPLQADQRKWQRSLPGWNRMGAGLLGLAAALAVMAFIIAQQSSGPGMHNGVIALKAEPEGASQPEAAEAQMADAPLPAPPVDPSVAPSVAQSRSLAVPTADAPAAEALMTEPVEADPFATRPLYASTPQTDGLQAWEGSPVAESLSQFVDEFIDQTDQVVVLQLRSQDLAANSEFVEQVLQKNDIAIELAATSSGFNRSQRVEPLESLNLEIRGSQSLQHTQPLHYGQGLGGMGGMQPQPRPGTPITANAAVTPGLENANAMSGSPPSVGIPADPFGDATTASKSVPGQNGSRSGAVQTWGYLVDASDEQIQSTLAEFQRQPEHLVAMQVIVPPEVAEFSQTENSGENLSQQANRVAPSRRGFSPQTRSRQLNASRLPGPSTDAVSSAQNEARARDEAEIEMGGAPRNLQQFTFLPQQSEPARQPPESARALRSRSADQQSLEQFGRAQRFDLSNQADRQTVLQQPVLQQSLEQQSRAARSRGVLAPDRAVPQPRFSNKAPSSTAIPDPAANPADSPTAPGATPATAGISDDFNVLELSGTASSGAGQNAPAGETEAEEPAQRVLLLLQIVDDPLPGSSPDGTNPEGSHPVSTAAP